MTVVLYHPFTIYVTLPIDCICNGSGLSQVQGITNKGQSVLSPLCNAHTSSGMSPCFRNNDPRGRSRNNIPKRVTENGDGLCVNMPYHQWTRDAIMTSFLRQNDVATSF